MLNVCDQAVMRPLLEKNGFHFSKAKGQNFLVQSWVPAQIADQAGIDRSCGVLEIGPGIGSLTQQLCLRAGKVAAVEVDTRLKPILGAATAEFDNLSLIWGDAQKLDIPALVREQFPGLRPEACANLPYYITSPILTALLEADCFEAVTVMVQKEVAERICALPGTADYSAFSIFCQYYAEPEILFEVPPTCFEPRPKVMSAVIALRVRGERPWDIPSPALFFRTVRASFLMRRKTLQNALAAGFPQLGKAAVGEVLESAGVSPSVRGETLDIAAFAAIAKKIGERI
ncbi:MAG: 16S rRNA (adenine(1518)-N(6)/adenine(1519)-N(6))-dimethyltransferase RsmA [Firmicutes bacterium]|nr:16S rRNA (adenine(1518)-N(6)/adenine(1519)-N(6))-dimethyltransferase RsmA [Bacillota bacterium]